MFYKMKKTRLTYHQKEIAYYKQGSGSREILFVHGNSLSSDTFLNQLNSEKFRKHFTMYALDLCGYGDSSRSKLPEADYSIRSQARLIVHFCKSLNIEKPILIGHSLGGNISIEALRELSLKALILVSSCPAQKPLNPEMFLSHPIIPLFFKPEINDREITEMSRALVSSSAIDIDFILQQIKKSDPNTRKQLSTTVEKLDYDDQAEQLKMSKTPLAFVMGEDENIYNLENIEKLGLNLLGHKIHLIKNSGHMPFYEQPELFNQFLIGLKNII